MAFARFRFWVNFAGLALLAACTASPNPSTFHATIERQLACMGTSLRVLVQSESRGDAVAISEQVVRTLESAEQRLTTWSESGELARFNSGAIEQASAQLRAEMNTALKWSQRTEGAFEPRTGALVGAWDLRATGRIPSARERRQAAADHSLWEEGAWGKGAGLAEVASQVQLGRGQAVQVDLGGQWLLLGEGEFRLSVAHPLQRQSAYLELCVPAGSLATTGNSERALDVDGQRVGHILDPRTGDSIDARGSVSVWHRSALAADCVATALFVLGPQAAMQWALQHPEFEVLFLEVQANDEVLVHATPKWREQLNLHSSS